MRWQSMTSAPKGRPTFRRNIVALVRFKGYEEFTPVTAYWCWGLKTPRWVFDGWKTGEEPMYWAEFPSVYGESEHSPEEYNPFEVAAAINSELQERERLVGIFREEVKTFLLESKRRASESTHAFIDRVLHKYDKR